MKKCEICSSPATVFLTQIINGKSTKVSLCAKCAKKKGLLDPSAFDLAEKLFSENPPKNIPEEALKAFIPPVLQPVSTSLPLTVCPACGLTIEDYRKVGRLGCAQCYDVFMEEIVPMLQQVQAGETHVGKRPERALQEARTGKDIQAFSERMEAAIKREDYEEAARLRDEIEKIKVANK